MRASSGARATPSATGRPSSIPSRSATAAWLMPRKVREIRADLRRAGFVIAHVDGSHETWRHPSGARVVLSGHDGADAQIYQERQARRQIAAARAAEEAKRKDKP